MSSRYITNVIMGLLGGLVVVGSQAFDSTTTGWLAFAVAIGLVATVAATQLDRARGAGQRALDGGVVILGITAIVTNVIYGGATTTWLAFAEFLGFVGLGVVGLTLHEVETWRSGHGLRPLRWDEPQQTGEETRRPMAA
jgi:hypothetical protein